MKKSELTEVNEDFVRLIKNELQHVPKTDFKTFFVEFAEQYFGTGDLTVSSDDKNVYVKTKDKTYFMGVDKI